MSGVWSEVAGWTAVLAGLASLAYIIARIDRRSGTAPRAHAAPVRRLGPAREWELAIRHAARDVSRAAELPALQASAAVKIDSAEHALNRLVADCARLRRTPASPPAHAPVPFARRHASPTKAPERRPLAA